VTGETVDFGGRSPLDVMAAEALAGDTPQLWESHK
jgi:hypothetical protein